MNDEQTAARKRRLSEARKAWQHVSNMRTPDLDLVRVTQQQVREAEDAIKAAGEEVPHPLQTSSVTRRNNL
jgi:hypothetical protein